MSHIVHDLRFGEDLGNLNILGSFNSLKDMDKSHANGRLELEVLNVQSIMIIQNSFLPKH